jgi:hypothetical protein
VIASWGSSSVSTHEGFQEQIRKSTSCNVVIAILRGRMGTPLSPEFLARLPPEERVFDGLPAPTGTAYEIVTAIAARRRGAKLPDIYAFRHALAPAPALDAADRSEIEAQWRQLNAFAAQVFITPEGHFKGALESYRTTSESKPRPNVRCVSGLRTTSCMAAQSSGRSRRKVRRFGGSSRSVRNTPTCSSVEMVIASWRSND